MRNARALQLRVLIAAIAIVALNPPAFPSELQHPSPAPAHAMKWKLLWHDEFNGPSQTPPDSTKWTYDLGNGGANRGWGNHELEQYSKDVANVFQDGQGHLVIRALRTPDNLYTSGRIKTHHKFSFKYGRVEARIKIPYAKGIWPAFWMLGNTYPKVPWPASGEVDIEENFGAAAGDQSTNHGTLHGPGYAGAGISGRYHPLDNSTLTDAFHTYSIVWQPRSVEFFVDGISYLKATPANLPPHARWVFDDSAYFLLLNLAVGGSPAPVGYPDDTTPFPQDMLIDYVRVFQLKQ
jgi:beta-glucanase (GH16 family)